MEGEDVRDGATNACSQGQTLVRRPEAVQVQRVELVRLVIPTVAGVGEGLRRIKGIDATQAVEAVCLKVSAQLCVGYKKISQQVQADFGLRVQEKRLADVGA